MKRRGDQRLGQTIGFSLEDGDSLSLLLPVEQAVERELLWGSRCLHLMGSPGVDPLGGNRIAARPRAMSLRCTSRCTSE